nr:ribonuclease H-like domain-containing protein [Tanacetum cinerariifolium]
MGINDIDFGDKWGHRIYRTQQRLLEQYGLVHQLGLSQQPGQTLHALTHQPTPMSSLIQQLLQLLLLYGLKQAPQAWFQRFAGMFLSQETYAHMLNRNPCHTLVDTDSKLGVDGDPVKDPTLYRSFACALQYLTFTRPYISYAVQHSSKRQVTLSCSSDKAEYNGVANVVALRNLLRELHTSLSSATLVYCDNVSAVYLSSNHVQLQCTKHIKIDIHFVRDLVGVGHVRFLHVPSRY